MLSRFKPFKFFVFLCFIAFFNLLSMSKAFPVQVAHIKSEKAIIYADQELQTPLGHASRGKKVKVGSMPRKYGTILPVLVAGRIGWIKVQDLEFSEMKDEKVLTTLEHQIEDFDVRDRFTEHNHITLLKNVFVFGKEWDNLLSKLGNELGGRPTSHTLLFEHRHPGKRYSFGIGLGHLNFQEEFISMSALTVDAVIYVSPLKFTYFTTDLFLGGQTSLDFRMRTIYQDENDNDRGMLYGFHYGLQFKFFPFQRFSFVNGVSFYQGKISDMSNLNLSLEENDSLIFNQFSAVNYYFGASYKF